MRVTKVLVPEPAASIIARPRLEAMAQRLLEVPVAIVAGGGGFGKSTVLAAWARALADRARVAWLSLEPEDGSATAMAEALEMSLRRAVPQIGRARAALREELGADSARTIATLCNELYAHTEDASEVVLLFIDDVHVLASEAGALEVLSELLRAAPPRVHIVLASRTALTFSPIAKLRAQGRVLDVDEVTLRFNASEALEIIGDRRSRSR